MATLTIELPEELEKEIEREAVRRGLGLADYIALLLQSRPDASSPRGASEEQTLVSAMPTEPPLREHAGGVLRVGDTRVSLDTVIGAFKGGCSGEEIVRRYPTLERADVYAVIAHYLRHPEEVEAYLERRRLEAAELRQEVETRWSPEGFREKLLARRVPE